MTLTIGVAASLFTALVVTRLIFNFLVERNLHQVAVDAAPHRSTKVDFMKVAKPLFVVTWLFSSWLARLWHHARRQIVRRGFPRRRQHDVIASRRKWMKKKSAPRYAASAKRTRRSSIKRMSAQHGNPARHHFQRFVGQGRGGAGDELSAGAISTCIDKQQVGATLAGKSSNRPSSPRCWPCSASWFMWRSATSSRSPWPPSSRCCTTCCSPSARIASPTLFPAANSMPRSSQRC